MHLHHILREQGDNGGPDNPVKARKGGASNIKKPGAFRDAPELHRTKTALVLAASLGWGQATVAENNPVIDKEFTGLETIEVYGERGALYKARRSGDDRHAAALADTPQTMTILTQTQLRDSGKTDLKEILSAQAGITLGTGEGGNAFGDRYVIRGHEARSDVFVDGVRDPGMTTRESFATEQIEITKGPSSTFAGRGSTGGAINSISKQATFDQDFAILDTSGGSDDYYRITVDGNKRLNDRFAVRANALYASEDVPDRDPAERERTGIQLSGLFTFSEWTSVTADFYYLDAEDVPDLGSYFDRTARKPIKDISVYLQDADFLNTEVETYTVKLKHEFTDVLYLKNSTRYGTTDNGYVTTGARGRNRHASDPEAPGAATFSLSGHQGWQEVEYFVNQLNIFWDTSFGDMDHRVVFGMEYSDEKVLNGTYSLTNTAPTNCVISGFRASSSPRSSHCGLDANGNPVPDIHDLLGRVVARQGHDSNFSVETISAYLMDTVNFSDSLSGFFGVRYDRFDYNNEVLPRNSNTFTPYEYDDGFWNGHLGIVYQLTESGNIYATYSTATNINGGESDVGGSCGYGGLCGTPEQVRLSDPEQTDNIELGTKWNLMDGRLLFTAALFRITKDDVMESVGSSYSSLGTLNTGKNRVEGIELSLTGNITDHLSVQFSAAFMDSEVLEAFNEDNVGLALSNFADNSVYLQLRYQATDRFAFGGAFSYQGEMYGGQPDTAAGFNASIDDYSIVVPSYEKIDLFANYAFSEKLNLRFNVDNVTDETYWHATYRSGSFMYIGDARTYRATLSWDI